MALMFPRLANNFAKNGYYPTDEKTVERMLTFLNPLEDDQSYTQIFDPCAGEGVALAEIKHRLSQHQTRAHGIEYDAERAYHAKNLLDVCIHGDVQDCIIKRNQFGLLFLNPPYGDLVSDQAQLSDKRTKGRQRLEKLFYQHTFQSLVFGGLMILIIPDYTLDKEFAGWITKHFTDLSVFRACDQQFKQLVIFGVRRRTRGLINSAGKRDALLKTVIDELEEIPMLTEPRYCIPNINSETPLVLTKMEASQLSEELNQAGSSRGMWGDFNLIFKSTAHTTRRPAMDLTDWHLALALASGHVTGFVKSDDGQSSLLIRGNTYKDKKVETVVQEDGKGNFSETRIHTDRFVSVIKGIDTSRRSTFGDIVTIR